MQVFSLLGFVCVVGAHVQHKIGRIPSKLYSATEAEKSFGSAFIDTHPVGYKEWKRGSSSIALPGGYLTLGAYYTTVCLGSPCQNYTVLYDTGSSNLAIPSVKCNSCGSGKAYDPSLSRTVEWVNFGTTLCNQCNSDGSTNCLFGQPYPEPSNMSLCGIGISYGGGSSFFTGPLVYDQVTWAGMSVVSGFIPMIENIPSASFSVNPLDGIIGFASEHNAVNPTYVPTLWKTLLAAGMVSDNLFGLCLTPESGGVMDVGFIDSNKYTGTLQYADIVQDEWFNVGLRDISVGGVGLKLHPVVYSFNNDQIGTFIDSGTGVVILGPALYQVFQDTFQRGWGQLPGVNGTSNIFNGRVLSESEMGKHLAEFPTISFSIAGQGGTNIVLELPPSAYFMLQDKQYVFGVVSVPGVSVVLGDPIMALYYLVHDKERMRVGFAPLKPQSCQ